jgi:thiol:disulfide interchange protein DsbD
MLGRLVFLAVVALGCRTTTAFEDKKIVRVESPDDFSISPGETKDATIRITVTDGFHVQANPAAKEFLIPLTLELTTEDDLKIGVVRYPKGLPYRIRGTEDDLMTYKGTFTVSVSIRAPASAAEGRVMVHGKLRYQACDDRVCLRPAELEFDFAARVRAAPKR